MLGKRAEHDRHAEYMRGNKQPRVFAKDGEYFESAPASKTFILESKDSPKARSDPTTPNYSIENRIGRGKEEKDQRRRKRAEQEQLVASMPKPSENARRPQTQGAPPARREIEAGADADAEFLAQVDQNSSAARALQIAQATLQAKREGTTGGARRLEKTEPSATPRSGSPPTAASRVR